MSNLTLTNSFGDISKSIAFSKGIIMLWYGQINNIPTGWAMCNGQYNTPDLRNKFVVGYTIAGLTGGSETATLDKIHLPLHSHTYNDSMSEGTKAIPYGGKSYPVEDSAEDTELAGGYVTSTGAWASRPHAIIPPYIALIYIMKIS
jgi:microcystin-dependent protein